MHPQSVLAGSSSGELRMSSILRDLRPCSKFLAPDMLLGVEVLWCISAPDPDEFFDDLAPPDDVAASSPSARLADDDRV